MSLPPSLSQQALSQITAGRAAYLEGLNAPQREAVETLDGPLLMLAGAGTGKTKALTCRIAHLLNMRKARANEILAVTFTNKAAREMRLRVGGLVGQEGEVLPWLGTFHSICVKLLRRHAELAGLKSNFTILDTDDQLRLMKQLIKAASIDEKRWPPRLLASLIDGWKNRALWPDALSGSDAASFGGYGAELYAAYQERLKTLNAVDFGDLLLHVVKIFQNNPDILTKYQNWFRYILVDEYQDTNIAQYLWLRLLAAGHKNICCVGDDDQSIYGWRGAEVGNILRFESDFPGAKIIRLEQNYRSTPHILGAAAGLISGNEGRLGKTLWTDRNEGDKLRLMGLWDGEEEARWIGEQIEAFALGARGATKLPMAHMAILVRASHQMRAFEDRFLSIGLPYRVIGGPRFYERLEVRDAMAYFRLSVSSEDDLAFERIVNTPRRGLGEKALQKINQAARQHGVSLYEGAQILIEEGGLPARARNALQRFIDQIAQWHMHLRDGQISHVEIAQMMLDESGYTQMWQEDKSPEAAGRLENLKELIKALENFDTLGGFLEHIALIMDNEQEEGSDKVSIMTLHAAKGLEFPLVFLPGWEEGLFPSQRSMDESGQRGLEEERRLGYVGITRAEAHCFITFAANRRIFGQWQSSLPSRFIDEIPAQHVEVMSAPGLYQGQRSAQHAPRAAHLHADEIVTGSEMVRRAEHADVYNSPGWARLHSLDRPTLHRPIIDVTPAAEFALGDRVFHQKFGYGDVTEIDGDKLAINFDKAGIKRVIGRFVAPATEEVMSR